MKQWKKLFVVVCVLALFIPAFSGCEGDNPLEEAGKKLEEAADAAEDAADAAKKLLGD